MQTVWRAKYRPLSEKHSSNRTSPAKWLRRCTRFRARERSRSRIYPKEMLSRNTKSTCNAGMRTWIPSVRWVLSRWVEGSSLRGQKKRSKFSRNVRWLRTRCESGTYLGVKDKRLLSCISRPRIKSWAWLNWRNLFGFTLESSRFKTNLIDCNTAWLCFVNSSYAVFMSTVRSTANLSLRDMAAPAKQLSTREFRETSESKQYMLFSIVYV